MTAASQLAIHCVLHDPFEGLGSIEAWVAGRGHRIFCHRLYAGEPFPDPARIDLLVLMGGPMGAVDEAAHPWLAGEKRFLDRALASRTRILGICLGAQLLAERLGSRVYRNATSEIGWFPIRKSGGAEISRFANAFPEEMTVFHWHKDTFDLPAGAVHLARSAACMNQGFLYAERVAAIQFHLESTRETIQLLLDHLPRDLSPGPNVQTRERMLSPRNPFLELRNVQFRLLDRMVEGLAVR
ncbi:MAG: type 1 glutamine amidotransferase [Candidatus Eisenbacteria bacterium]